MSEHKIHHIRNNLSVCGFSGIAGKQNFPQHDFKAHLQCQEGFDDWLKEYVEVKCLPFDDGRSVPYDVLDEAQIWLSDHWDQGHRILISCAAGESRSVVMAICLLSRKTESSFLEACEEVFAKIPKAYPHPSILISGANYCGVVLDLAQLKDLYMKISEKPPFSWTEDTLKDALKNQL